MCQERGGGRGWGILHIEIFSPLKYTIYKHFGESRINTRTTEKLNFANNSKASCGYDEK